MARRNRGSGGFSNFLSGLIGAGVIPSPIPYADFATSSCWVAH